MHELHRSHCFLSLFVLLPKGTIRLSLKMGPSHCQRANLSIPAYHQRASAPTNLTLHQAISINKPIGCGDVAVSSHMILSWETMTGVMVIPQHLVEEVIEGFKKLEKRDK